MGETESFDLSQIPQLSKEHVHIKNIDAVKKKLRTIIEGESKLLQLITDFDRTLTKSKHDGVPTLSSHCIFESCKELPKYFRDGCRRLVEKYHPIEMAPNLTIEEKVPYMVEWWKQSEDLCCGLVIDRKTLDIAVGEANVKFRDRCKEVFVKLNEHSVPVLVFSAGLGDVIKSVLRHESLDYPNIHVISNFFRFEGSKIIGFEGPTIHIFNKNQEAVKNSEYFQEVKNRTNVILMGDSLGDANMAEGLPKEATILKIGYLSSNHNDEYLPQYMDHFDIVLVNDETMEIPMTIVNSVIP